jgi:choline dehydrogenase-like flavoprotein
LKTPQLLELSGIGSRAVLEKQQIPVKIDLPSVGENLQEHMFAALSWEVKEGVSFDTLDLLRDSKGSADHLELQ